MKDRKFHNKKPKDNYPAPGVPADDAWAAMNRLLDADSNEPSVPGNRKIPGRKRIYGLVVLLVGVVTLFFLLNTMKHQEKIPGKNAGTNKAVNYATGPGADTAQVSSVTGKTVLDEHVKTNDQHRGQSNERILPNETFASAGNKSPVTKNHYHTTVKDTRNNNLIKDNKANPATGGVVIKPTSIVYSSNSGKDKKNNDTKNFAGATGRQPNNEIPHGRAFQTEHEVSKIENIETAEFTGISSLLASFITARARAELDSAFFQKLRNSITSANTSGRREIKSTSKINSTNTGKEAGFGYGFQWNVPIPVQGTAGYFRGTNGKSKPYNLLLPEVWLSKSFKRKSKIFVSVDFNRQYFINNKELLERALFMAARDTGINETFLYKTGGFGAGLSYSYEINKNLAAALGIDYTLNRTALLNKQTRNAITGHIISDSLYGINRQSSDWSYINKNLLATKLELYYTLKKINLGAAVYVPLSTVPVYGNKKIHPVNARLFIRWNIK